MFRKGRELYDSILTIAIAAIAVAWISFAWTSMTGLTFATRSGPGRIATQADKTSSRHVAVLTTVVAFPLALWAASMRKRL